MEAGCFYFFSIAMAIKYCLSPKILTSCQTFKPSDLQLPSKSTGCLLTWCKMQSVRRMGYLTKHGIPYWIIQSLETFKIFFFKKQMQLVSSQELWDLRHHTCLWEHIILQASCFPLWYQNLCWPKNSPHLSQSYRSPAHFPPAFPASS